MGFQLPNLPNVTPNIPQMPSPLEQYGKMLQLKSLNGQVQQQQQMAPLQLEQEKQAVQASTLENQQRQQEVQSQQAMIKAWSDPDFLKGFTGTDKAQTSGVGFDPDALSASLISKGVLPKDAMAMTQSFIERSQKIATTQKDVAQTGEANAAVRDKGMKILADKIGGILDLPTAKASDALAALKQDIVKNQKNYAGVPPEDLAHLYAADLEHLPAMSTLMGLDAKIADFHKSKAEAAKAAQGVIPDGGGLSPDSQQKVATDVAVATNPQIQQGKEAVAAAEGRARANLEAQIARGSNAALAAVPPHMVAPATADATKAGLEYAQAKSVSDRLALMMKAAEKGNVVAYQLIPEEGALQLTTSQGVHRINMAEIQNYEGGGSLWQRLEGHIGKALTGKSVPQSVLDDMKEMQKVQADGSRTKYENSLTTINQAYGSKFTPVDMKEIDSARAATGKSVKIGGNDIALAADGTFDYQGHTYKDNGDGKGATLVK